ncbi:DUF3006 domain-containing protein [Alkalihalobacillus sp. MEB130]|uniref:DUF3006 family protein n=1 Tax=Alkalihalobacillus sp. MEB130 TaxID=2976704 RepID=UPI0028E09D43|nr:DUF3006 family protein [Alkalihalobacillus sp. MEB130]MDT8858832.1 DUF3006 domain-containing protein [Alkalihalobacillus sp. MEB130]
MSIYTVDSVEDGIAHLLLREDESVSLYVKQEQLPGVSEGDLIEADVNKEGIVASFRKLEQETKQARAKARELLQKLREKNK